MDTEFSTFRRKLDAKHRLAIPRVVKVEWSKKRPIAFVPLSWRKKRELLIPPERRMEAWTLCNFDKREHEDRDWRLSPWRVLDEASQSPTAAERARLVFKMSLDNRTGSWQLMIPKLLRDLHWLPSAGEYVILHVDIDGLSLWTELAFQIHNDSLGANYELDDD